MKKAEPEECGIAEGKGGEFPLFSK